jgi:hypothetical protein
MRSSLVQFYQRFLECGNLKAWLHARRAVAEQWQVPAAHTNFFGDSSLLRHCLSAA